MVFLSEGKAMLYVCVTNTKTILDVGLRLQGSLSSWMNLTFIPRKLNGLGMYQQRNQDRGRKSFRSKMRDYGPVGKREREEWLGCATLARPHGLCRQRLGNLWSSMNMRGLGGRWDSEVHFKVDSLSPPCLPSEAVMRQILITSQVLMRMRLSVPPHLEEFSHSLELTPATRYPTVHTAVIWPLLFQYHTFLVCETKPFILLLCK